VRRVGLSGSVFMMIVRRQVPARGVVVTASGIWAWFADMGTREGRQRPPLVCFAIIRQLLFMPSHSSYVMRSGAVIEARYSVLPAHFLTLASAHVAAVRGVDGLIPRRQERSHSSANGGSATKYKAL